jgi:hypothetical protein
MMGQQRKGLAPSWEIEPLPSHDTRIPNVPLYDEMEEQGPPPTYSAEILDNPHPTDLEEGYLEKLIKYAAEKGNNYGNGDRLYLEQYLHPERDIIPKQNLRPTKNGIGPSDNLEYRRMPEEEPMRVGNTELKRYPIVDGLGGYTLSEGDKYNSIYDKWDFDTAAPLVRPAPWGKNKGIMGPVYDAAGWAAKKVMQNVGTPFHVYERYNKDELPEYFDLEKEYMKTYEANKALEEKEKKGKK